MDISVGHEVMKDKRGRIHYRKFRKGGYDHYHITIFLVGNDVERVSYVEYELHPTFSKPIRISENSKDNYSISIWTWGVFEVGVTIYLKDGNKEYLAYDLKYSNSLPPGEDLYVDESPEIYREA